MFKANRATKYDLSVGVDDMEVIDIPALRQHIIQQREFVWEDLDDICPRTCPSKRSNMYVSPTII